MHETLPILLHPFGRGLLAPPQTGERVLFLGAPAAFRPPSWPACDLQTVQDVRPDYLALEEAGLAVAPAPDGKDYDAVLVLLGRHRKENERRLAEALRRVRGGGLVLAAGSKKDGAQSVARRLAELHPLEDRVSKHHGVAFWLRPPGPVAEKVAAALSQRPRYTPEGYETAIGGFSEGAVDPGARLLASALPKDISGDVADFAAGWGCLALSLAQRFTPRRLDLYEAHAPSLEAARRNLAERAHATRCGFFWHDLLGEPVGRRYHVIVMNPPFHRARAAEPDMGRAMIAVAAAALKPKGRLFLVANRSLPYEAAMETAFGAHGELCRAEGYKVLWGTKRPGSSEDAEPRTST